METTRNIFLSPSREFLEIPKKNMTNVHVAEKRVYWITYLAFEFNPLKVEHHITLSPWIILILSPVKLIRIRKSVKTLNLYTTHNYWMKSIAIVFSLGNYIIKN